MKYKIERRTDIGVWVRASGGYPTVEAAISAKDDRFIERVKEDPHEGWSWARERAYGGLWVLRDPDGVKQGQTATEAGIKIMFARRCTDR